MKNETNTTPPPLRDDPRPKVADECNGARAETSQELFLRQSKAYMDGLLDLCNYSLETEQKLKVAQRLLRDVLAFAHTYVPPPGVAHDGCSHITQPLAVLALQIQRETGLSIHQPKS
jgi:hypothetical protein